MSTKTEDLKTVKVDVEAVIAEARKNGALLPDGSIAPLPTPPKPAASVAAPKAATPASSIVITPGRISG